MENTTLDDEATQGFSNGYNPYSGSYTPLDDLSAFDGETIAGVWTLMFYDDTTGDNGSLEAWSIELVLE